MVVASYFHMCNSAKCNVFYISCSWFAICTCFEQCGWVFSGLLSHMCRFFRFAIRCCHFLPCDKQKSCSATICSIDYNLFFGINFNDWSEGNWQKSRSFDFQNETLSIRCVERAKTAQRTTHPTYRRHRVSKSIVFHFRTFDSWSVRARWAAITNEIDIKFAESVK